MMMRLDALSPGAVFRSADSLGTHNLKADRDFIDIFMQGHGDRSAERRQFRSIATDMADRYLPLVQTLRNRGQLPFTRLIPTEPPRVTEAKLRELSSSLERAQRKLDITATRRANIDQLVSAYLAGTNSGDKEPEVGLAMTRILMHRYHNRVSGMEASLFEEFDPEPKTPLKADAGIAEGARLHLHEELGRPLHYGLDNLCDASNENAELFLQLAGALVARMETNAIRGKSPVLPASTQQTVLADKAKEIMTGWAFPFARRVRSMVDSIAKECRQVSLADNARLAAGANAIGVPDAQIEKLINSDEELALVLKYAIAHKAIEIQRDYGQGGKQWCLIELSGIVCLAHGLTLRRGGFLERDLDYIREMAA
jgi:hypothetical protein